MSDPFEHLFAEKRPEDILSLNPYEDETGASRPVGETMAITNRQQNIRGVIQTHIAQPQSTGVPLPSYKPCKLSDIPQRPEAVTLTEQLSVLRQAAAFGEEMGLLQPLEKHTPDKQNDRNIVVHLTPILHFPEAQLKDEIDLQLWHTTIRCELELFRMEKIYARHGMAIPLHHEGKSLSLGEFQVMKDGKLIDGYSDQGQELLFDDLHTFCRIRLRMARMPQVINPKEMIAGTIIRGTYLPENDSKRKELSDSAREGLKLYVSDRLLSASIPELESAIAGAELSGLLNDLTEEEHVKSIEQTAPGQLHRLAAGGAHTAQLIETFLRQGYPVLVTRPRSLPDHPLLQASRETKTERLSGLKRLLELRRMGC